MEVVLGPLFCQLMTFSIEARLRAKANAQAVIDAALPALACGAITEAEWQRRVTDALADSYLREENSENDPRWQSGFDGDVGLWREARALVLDAVSLLDVGCANGHLMECLAAWASERGVELTLYGLDLNPALAGTARRRLPAWADRIYTGNIVDWTAPGRFTYVRTGLEYVAPDRDPDLIARLIREVVAPGGRLIVGPVSETDVPATAAAFAAAGIPTPGVVGATDRNGKTRYVVYVERDQAV